MSEEEWFAFRRDNITLKEVYICDICKMQFDGYFKCVEHLMNHWKKEVK